MSVLIGALGILVLLIVAFLLSNDKKNINYKSIVIMLAVQLLLGAFLLGTSVGQKVIESITNVFTKILSYGNEGITFVFGDRLLEEGVFFVQTLAMIIFISALLSILNYTKILPLAIKYIGGFVSKITGLPKVESFVAVNAMVFGDTTAIIAVKDHIGKLSKNRLFVVTTTSLVSVSCSILGAYMMMVPAEYVLVALPLNVFSGLIVSSIVCPVKLDADSKEDEIDTKNSVEESTLFEAIGNGALMGGKVALIVAAMLVTYVGLLALVNGVLNGTLGFDLQTILGYVLYPVGFLMGIPASELVTAGGIMGTKVVANEFVAMLQLQPLIPTLTEKTVGIVTSFLISFANFSSVGIVIGAIQAINGEKAKEVASFGLKMLLVATMGSILTGTIVGLFL